MNNCDELQQIAEHLAELTIYRTLPDNPLIRQLLRLARRPGVIPPAAWYGAILEQFPEAPEPWCAFLETVVLENENYFSLACERGDAAAIPSRIAAAVKADLQILIRLAQWTPGADFIGQAASPMNGCDNILVHVSEDELYQKLAQRYATRGAGAFGKYAAFNWENRSQQLKPIPFPDPVTFANLIGNTYQKEVLIQNTRQFLRGLPANNILLYGDRGTGKSSSIKALGNEFAPHGLRLIEVSKENLADFPVIIDRLRQRGLKFIIYVDDLSFETNETQYKHLKAVLEGGLEAKPANVLIYATSNRRHLIRETHKEREVEIHGNDVVQEQLSLADRFGITLTFLTPDQQEYLAIVGGLAQQRGIHLPATVLEAQAIEWERRQNGRSGRTARQFIDHLQGELGLS